MWWRLCHSALGACQETTYELDPYGTFELDMKKRLPLDAPVELLVQ